MSKSLYLIRWLGEAGHKVILYETPKYWCSGSRFSKYVHAFYTVSDFREDEGKKYRQELLEIAKRHQIDWFIPACSPASENIDSFVADDLRSELNCKVLHLASKYLETYQNKHMFCELVGNLGLKTPRSFIVHSDEDALKINKQLHAEGLAHNSFILKNLQYDPIHRLDMFALPCTENKLREYLKKIKQDGNGLSAKEPWQIQQFISGPEYTALAVVKCGVVVLLSTSRSSPSHFNWKQEDVQQIEEWHLNFFSKQPDVSGIFTTDFILNRADNEVYAFENNPRLGSLSSLLLPVDNIAKQMLKPVDTGVSFKSQLLKPPMEQFETYILMNEVFKLIEPKYYDTPYESVGDFFGRLKSFMKLVTFGKDPLIDGNDIMPFVMFNYFQVPVLLIDVLVSGNQWKKVDFQIGKVVQMGGD